jgi:CO/xanthine dehydrogenase FAD-binding subunit
MSDLQYESPDSVAGAVALLAGATGITRVLAGGTDVLVQLHADLVEPDLVVDIKRIPGLKGITREAAGYRIGANTTGMEMIDHAEFVAAWPGIIDGVKLIGSMQVKGRATIAGNLCNASPAADSAPPMVAAGAIASITGPGGSRELPVAEIAIAPGKTSLAQGEIITSFFVPDAGPHSGSAYLRFTPRTEMDIAVVGCAVNLTLDASGTCTAARMALGAVAARVLLVEEAAGALVGTKVDDAALDKLAAVASAACKPIDDKRGTKVFRIKVAGVLARRVATLALERARKQGAKG